MAVVTLMWIICFVEANAGQVGLLRGTENNHGRLFLLFMKTSAESLSCICGHVCRPILLLLLYVFKDF